MTEKINDISAPNIQKIEAKEIDKQNFSNKIAGLNALACNNVREESFQLDKALKESQSNLKALSPSSAIQEMLASQMLSNHSLHQSLTAMANASHDLSQQQYYINMAIKLSTCFTNQAALLAKLQGAGSQKIIVEHVEVHSGGQAAFVNNINRGASNDEK